MAKNLNIATAHVATVVVGGGLLVGFLQFNIMACASLTSNVKQILFIRMYPFLVVFNRLCVAHCNCLFLFVSIFICLYLPII